MEYIVGLLTVLVGGVLYLFNQNQKLKSDNKIADTKIEDAKLETKQENLKNEATKVQLELDKATVSKVDEQQSAEDFWKNRESK